MTKFEYLYDKVTNLEYYDVKIFPMENNAGFYVDKKIVCGRFDRQKLNEEQLIISKFENLLQELAITLGFYEVKRIIEDTEILLKKSDDYNLFTGYSTCGVEFSKNKVVNVDPYKAEKEIKELELDDDKFLNKQLSELHWEIIGTRDLLYYYFVNNLHAGDLFKKWWKNKLKTFVVPKED